MKKNNIFRRSIAFLIMMTLLFQMLSYEGNRKEVKAASFAWDELTENENGVYDVLIKFRENQISMGSEDLEEAARYSQKNVISLLEKAKIEGKVSEYKSFYIVNSIHALVLEKEVLEEIHLLPEVEKIQNNGRIYKIDPIKRKRRFRRATAETSTLYAPDERNIEWGVLAVQADKVWDEFGVKGEGVTVGIIDTGVNYRLPALKKSYKGYDEVSGQFDSKYYKDCINGMSEPEVANENDHGTHVAGTICGSEEETGANGKGVNQIGVAPKVKFISAKALDNNGGSTSDLLEAAEWMLQQKPDIINNSWGGGADADEWFKAIAEAWRNAGILPVFASGNRLPGEGLPGLGSISNPGNLLNVFSVGAIDINKRIGDFSKKGPSAFDSTGNIIKPDIVAPGVQVRSLDAKGRYVSWNGTSMATPHLVGVAALIKSAAKKKNIVLSVEELERLIRETAEPLSDETYTSMPNMAYGYGLVNAYNAVAKIMENRVMGEITGYVYKEGEDTRGASVFLKSGTTGYVGRDFLIKIIANDDVAVKSAILEYTVNAQKKKSVFKRVEGTVKAGTYETLIPAEDLKQGNLDITIIVTDFSDQEVVKEETLTIKEGIRFGYENNFETEIDGFLLNDEWNWSQKVVESEPSPKNGMKYVGIRAGSAKFERQKENYLYLPPIDLTGIQDSVHLSLDEYRGFEGSSVAQIQVSGDNGNTWDVLHNVLIRPDYELTSRTWEHHSYSLSDYRGQSSVLVRLYFYGSGTEEGVGWYIDNLALGRDSWKPRKVEGLSGDIVAGGLELRLKKVEEIDVSRYEIERVTTDKQGGNEERSSINYEKAQWIEEFVHKTDTERSHYKMVYLDTAATEDNKIYKYRVRAVDEAGNEGEYSEFLTVDYRSVADKVNYDFNQGNDGFNAVMLEQSTVNDWEWGIPDPNSYTGNEFLNRDFWENMKARTEGLNGMWATKLNEKITQNQDAALVMPEFPVEDGDEILIHSFSSISAVSSNTLKVEYSENQGQSWSDLIGKERIQRAEKLRTWQELKEDLSRFSGKRISIRFRITTGNTIVDSYEYGWYLDNIRVRNKNAGKIHFETSSILGGIHTDNEQMQEGMEISPLGNTALSNPTQTGIPLGAKLIIKETGKYTYANETDGSYRLLHAINQNGKPYTLEVSAYGYKTQNLPIDFQAEPYKIRKDFKLEPADSLNNISGKVVDEEGHALDGVNVKLVNEHIGIVTKTNLLGEFTFTDSVFSGSYKLRMYKEGYESEERKVEIGTNTNLGSFVIEKQGEKKVEVVDYGYTIKKNDKGQYPTTHFVGSIKGNAVRFQPSYKRAILKNIQLFLVQNDYYAGNHIKVGVLGYDKEGRLRELMPFRELENVVANEWNIIDVSEYGIKKEEPIYVATRYEKMPKDSIGLFYDVETTEKAKKRSFIYDGTFTKVTALSVPGAYAVKVTYLYDVDAIKNREFEEDEVGSSEGNNSIITESDQIFEFDKASNTITKYLGKSESVKIPRAIANVPVLKIGKNAFDGTNNGMEKRVKLKQLVISEGITEIGAEAFRNNALSSISLPSTLKKIGAGAFKYQIRVYDKDKKLEVEIPKQVAEIEESVFEGAGSPLIVKGMEGVRTLKRNSFAGNAEVEITAPKLMKIEEGAFGMGGSPNMMYAKVYTKNSSLSSKNGEYLVNPARITVNMVDAKDSENILRIGLIYGSSPNPISYKRNIEAERFYKIGQRVTVSLPEITDVKNGETYISKDKAELLLEKENVITFSYYKKKPEIRAMMAGDTKIMGFFLPDAFVDAYIGGVKIGSGRSNEDGFFEIEGLSLEANQKVTLKRDDKTLGEESVYERPNASYLFDKTGKKILRYLGNETKVVLPNSFGSSGVIEEIESFAFYKMPVEEVLLSDGIQTIGGGAFLETGVQALRFTTKDMAHSKLRTIKEYAFKGSKLKTLELPELTHIIQKKAFASNELIEVHLPKYLGHVGDYAFYDNRLTEIRIPGGVEEIGIGSFAKNKLQKLIIEPKSKTTHGTLEEIPEYAFAENELTEVTLPNTISSIHGEAFAKNRKGKVRIITQNKNLKSGASFTVPGNDDSSQSGGDYGGNGNEREEKKEEKKEEEKKEEIEKKEEKKSEVAKKEEKEEIKKENEKKTVKIIDWTPVSRYLKLSSLIKLNLTNPVIPEHILRELKSLKKRLLIVVDKKLSFELNGKRIKILPKKAFNLKLKRNYEKEKKQFFKSLKEGNYVTTLECFAPSKIGFQLKMNVILNKKYKGRYAHLVSLGKDGQKIKKHGSSKIDERGRVTFSPTHLETYYVIVTKQK